MLDIDRVWSRVSQLQQYRGSKLTDFMFQEITYASQLTSGQAIGNQPISFPAGAIIVGIRGGSNLDTAVATQTTRDGLDLFKLAITDQQNNRNIVGTSQVIASTVFGRFNDQCPAKEIIIPPSGGLIYSFTNLTTSTIDIFFAHDCLVPNTVH